MDLKEAEHYYASIGFSRRTGFGERPALLVIDCNHGCSDPAVSSMAIAMDEEIRNIRRLLDLARAKQFPVVHTTVVYTEEHFRDGRVVRQEDPSLEALRPGVEGSRRSCPSWPRAPGSWCSRSGSPVRVLRHEPGFLPHHLRGGHRDRHRRLHQRLLVRATVVDAGLVGASG